MHFLKACIHPGLSWAMPQSWLITGPPYLNICDPRDVQAYGGLPCSALMISAPARLCRAAQMHVQIALLRVQGDRGAGKCSKPSGMPSPSEHVISLVARITPSLQWAVYIASVPP